MLEAVIDSKELAEALSYWATTGGIVVAIIAGLGALWKHTRDHHDREWDRAREAYARFMALALQHPQFYPGFWTRRDRSDLALTNQFEWYISHFLWACEDILTNRAERDEWWDSLKITIASHEDYFSSEEFAGELRGYFTPVRELVEETIREMREAELLALGSPEVGV